MDLDVHLISLSCLNKEVFIVRLVEENKEPVAEDDVRQGIW